MPHKTQPLTYDDIELGGKVQMPFGNDEYGEIRSIDNWGAFRGVDEPVFHVSYNSTYYYFGLKYVLKFYKRK
jgi:hypothetical protein